jgi:hypothetical protein
MVVAGLGYKRTIEPPSAAGRDCPCGQIRRFYKKCKVFAEKTEEFANL